MRIRPHTCWSGDELNSMNKLAITAAAGLVMLAATTELVRAQDGGEMTVYTKPLITETKQASDAGSKPQDGTEKDGAIKPGNARDRLCRA